jgi:hypothetical protein
VIRLAVLLTVVACSHPAPPATAGSGSDGSAASAGGPPVIGDEAGATANTGKRVGVKGTARNAKIGGIIQTADHLNVYCGGVSEWPSDVNGKVVTAFGTLTHSDKFEAKQGSGGEISQGTNGPVWLLENCQYE